MASSMDTDAQQSPFSISKRPRAYSENSTGALQHDDYTIGWISALPLEMTAAEIMLDHIHPPLPQHPQDGNTYTLGSINEHNVVIACLPKGQYGTNNAATVANDMTRSFPHIQHRLMVGIGGGAPKLADVRLGDVVVSTEVVQSDMGKLMPNDQFQRTSHPVRPPHSLMTAVSKLQASHSRGQNQMYAILSESISQLTHYARPNILDRLFENDYDHPHSSEDCNFCDQSQLVTRPARQTTDQLIHYGRIASGNQVIKDARTRDKLSEELGVICFEMEAAGLMNSSPCLVVRGICDYSDSHKNKTWQEYAAIVAAVYTKELVMAIPSQTLQSWKRRRTQKLLNPEPIDPEADECLRAMFVTDASLDREGILDAKGDVCEGTCEWILSTDEFQTWDQNPPHLLWISAPPGMGKTFMSIYLSKHFEARGKRSETAAIFFFCDNKVETRNTAVNILRGLMHQLISHQPNLVNTIIPQWKQQSDQLFQEKSLGTLWKLFEDAIVKSDFTTIYCVIDGLDECEASSLSLLLRKFERLSRGHLGTSPKMKLVCLSRRYPENIPEALLLFAKIELDKMTAREDDISRFISFQVQELAQKKKLNLEMRSLLEETFQKKSEGTFLWVSFMSQDLQKQRLLDFEESLEMLPDGLDAVYERILQNVEFEKGGMIRDILYWILIAARPFTIAELCEAVHMKPTRFLTREEVCIELIKSCGHLLQITDKPMRVNSVQQTVTFLHQSAKDYLMKFEPRFGSQIPGLAHPQLHEHATIVLIQYLEQINCHKRIEDEYLDDITNDFILAQYAVAEWEHHFRELEDITQVMRQGVSFFETDSKVRGMWQHLYPLPEAYDIYNPVPLLHLSALLALDSLAKWCLRHDGEYDVGTKWGNMEQTALVIACERRQEYIISLLLDAGANPIADNYVALDVALSYCNRRILHLMAQTEPCRKFLIQRASDQDGGLIYEAATVGNKNACRFLIEDLGWDLNWQSGRVGYSALKVACFY
ncbi:Vegetative incompatibility protein HET-E-1 [Fusarium oxysporum f. sp. rapae]|uniref:Vegetative incompatibility protein HET-E-1 n=1 Tax=Fusarium oxysporum f. sp. rapae TaxID=485398 RepID=A0A8J5NKV8_FUSOX|nr:Vegetative incompatibility protein HET-E-1 [Fusarium oxysporum f. sp. rapae]